MSSRETFRVPSICRGFGQAKRANRCCLTCKHLYIHQQRLTNADLENSETQQEEVLWSFGVPPVGRGERATVAVYLLLLYQGHYGGKTFKNVRYCSIKSKTTGYRFNYRNRLPRCRCVWHGTWWTGHRAAGFHGSCRYYLAVARCSWVSVTPLQRKGCARQRFNHFLRSPD